MRCLWLTRKYPQPANSGELIYSAGLIASFAEAGADLTVIAHDNDERPVGSGADRSRHCDALGVNWRLGSPKLNGRAMSLLTSLPGDSFRLKHGGPEEDFAEALKDGRKWDAVVFDHAAMGWALKPLQKHFQAVPRPDRPRLVYVSHNHEARVRREVAAWSRDPFPKSLALRWDAHKYAAQERALCREADLVTAITETEATIYRQEFPGRETVSLSPGYSGPAHEDRVITGDTPRRVILTGSFEWIAKRINLERFLEIAAEPFVKAGIELQIVGKTGESFRRKMAEQYPAVDFVGTVPDVSPYLLEARMGLIVEIVGGGFKLKSLDYVFHGLPIAGLEDAVEGLPLESPGEILLRKSVPNLVRDVGEVVDDFARLNQMREISYRKCADAFRWEDRGRFLFQEIEKLREQPLTTR